jgi:nucleoside-diphosphate-sugar epimerase
MPRPRSSPPADVLVTGASGFLGAALLAELLPHVRGRIFALSRRASQPRSGRVVALAHDLAQPLPRAALPERIRCVYHCASPPGPSTDLRALRTANVDGTLRLYDFAARAGARRFVFVSSGGVCRRGARPIAEDAPLAPDTPYLAAKAAGELVLRLLGGPVPVAVARPFFPYGPGQREGLLPRLCERLLRGEPIQVGRGGGPRLNPIHVRDAARLIRAIAERSAGDVVVNLAGPETISLLRLARVLGRHLGSRPVLEMGQAPRPSLVGDLRRLHGYGVPRRALGPGLRAFVKAWRAARA